MHSAFKKYHQQKNKCFFTSICYIFTYFIHFLCDQHRIVPKCDVEWKRYVIFDILYKLNLKGAVCLVVVLIPLTKHIDTVASRILQTF